MMEESGKLVVIAILAVLVIMVMVAVATVFKDSAPDAKIPGVCDVVEGKAEGAVGSAVGKGLCLPINAVSWVAGKTAGALG
ncbi:MAG: hypothetical protein HY516_00630 [Candidatus Aenigmarchaeota archaeon]|nr:hypothetical protein [Candidatus Aenigmarchaeota archaeon]